MVSIAKLSLEIVKLLSKICAASLRSASHPQLGASSFGRRLPSKSLFKGHVQHISGLTWLPKLSALGSGHGRGIASIPSLFSSLLKTSKCTSCHPVFCKVAPQSRTIVNSLLGTATWLRHLGECAGESAQLIRAHQVLTLACPSVAMSSPGFPRELSFCFLLLGSLGT